MSLSKLDKDRRPLASSDLALVRKDLNMAGTNTYRKLSMLASMYQLTVTEVLIQLVENEFSSLNT